MTVCTCICLYILGSFDGMCLQNYNTTMHCILNSGGFVEKGGFRNRQRGEPAALCYTQSILLYDILLL